MFNSRKAIAPLAFALVAASVAAESQAISITTAGQVYNQNFDTLTAATGSASWSNNSTLSGWYLFTGGNAAITTYSGGDGSSNAGAFNSFGATGSSERALGGTGSGGTYFGSPASGAVAGYIAVSFTNNTGATLDGFGLSFNGEQWRNGGNTNAQTMTLEYGFGNDFASVAWTAPGAGFNWSSPVVGSTAAAVNGNTAGLVSNVGGNVAAPWANGATLWVRWTELNDVGNDHGLGIDNFSLTTAAPVPLPAAAWLLLSGMGAVGAIGRRRRK